MFTKPTIKINERIMFPVYNSFLRQNEMIKGILIDDNGKESKCVSVSGLLFIVNNELIKF